MSKKTAFVVDDDPLVRQVIERILLKLGITSQMFHNGQEALDSLKKGDMHYELAVVDLVLPNGINGWQVVDALLESDDNSDIPIIVITGAFISEFETERLKNKVNKVILKQNFSVGTFSKVLNELLEI